jgi:hypothetical protein
VLEVLGGRVALGRAEEYLAKAETDLAGEIRVMILRSGSSSKRRE